MRKTITCPKCGGLGCNQCNNGWITIWEDSPRRQKKELFDYVITVAISEIQQQGGELQCAK